MSPTPAGWPRFSSAIYYRDITRAAFFFGSVTESCWRVPRVPVESRHSPRSQAGQNRSNRPPAASAARGDLLPSRNVRRRIIDGPMDRSCSQINKLPITSTSGRTRHRACHANRS